MANKPTLMPALMPKLMVVVAAMFTRADGRFLMHCRPEGKQHGGLWEFPGGKVEPGESAAAALVREVKEELGVAIEAGQAVPVAFAETPIGGASPGIVILLYTVPAWQGELQALEGGAVGWFTEAELRALPKPPLDCDLVKRVFGENDA